jgi:hypothetical protein
MGPVYDRNILYSTACYYILTLGEFLGSIPEAKPQSDAFPAWKCHGSGPLY